VDDERWAAFERKREAIAREQERLRTTWINPRFMPAGDAERVFGKQLEREYSLLDLLRRPDVTYAGLMTLPGAKLGIDARDASEQVARQVETQAKYAGYIERQRQEVARRETQESLRLPANLDYRAVRGLSTEVRQKLERHRPETLGQAARLSGVTPAAISLLLVHLRRGVTQAKDAA
jgi:tRNA uridine 5-carboxymethylaminomethyl modification enzyme